jgi:hypothetical protein
MPTKRSVSDIKANLLLRPALTSHFEVQIPTPGGGFGEFLAQNRVNLNQERLNLMCCEATLPGSNLATLELTNDFHGVTERHAYRRVYDDRIDLTFYVDAQNYMPIRFFETWMKYISNESITPQSSRGTGSLSDNYFYRVRYPDGDNGYTSSGLEVTKFERDYSFQTLKYTFVKAFPISLTSMPITYDASSLLRCTVSMTYIRYVLNTGEDLTNVVPPGSNLNLTPAQQATINANALAGTNTSATNLALQGIGGANLGANLGLSNLATTSTLSNIALQNTIGGNPQSAANASGNTLAAAIQQVNTINQQDAIASRAARISAQSQGTRPPQR